MQFSFKKYQSYQYKKLNILFLSNIQNLPLFLSGYKYSILTMLNANNFNYKLGDRAVITVAIDKKIIKFLFCGINGENSLFNFKILKLGGDIIDQLSILKVQEVAILINEKYFKVKYIMFIKNLCEGIKLKNYTFNKYNNKNYNLDIKKIIFYVSNLPNCKKSFYKKEIIVNSSHFARDLVSEPANILNPDTFVYICCQLEELGIKVSILSRNNLKKMGMNGILSVGQGSSFGTYVVSMEWHGNSNINTNSQSIAFIGKGITFDTGGINLKPSGKSISLMKYDMGGAAIVVSLIKSLAQRKASVTAIGVIGIAENMLSSTSQRPGDIITSMSGKTIEIDNTDAEGRLLLADIMWYTQCKFKPSIMIDLATLTGAVIVSLGNHTAGLFGNNHNISKKLYRAGVTLGEILWKLPINNIYDNLIYSDIADIKNTGKGSAGSISAAQFLNMFVNKECKWAHIDIAGVNWSDDSKCQHPKGATGYGVRLLNEFLIQNYEK